MAAELEPERAEVFRATAVQEREYPVPVFPEGKCLEPEFPESVLLRAGDSIPVGA